MKTLLKIFFKTIISSYFYSSICMASMQGIFKIDAEGKKITNGDIVDSQLSIMPWEQNQDINFLKKYIGKPFLEHFYVVDITDIEEADNLLEANLRIAIKKSFSGQSSSLIHYDKSEIPVEIIKDGFVSEKKNVENFILFEQVGRSERTSYYVFVALFISIGSVALWMGFNYYKKRKRRMKMARDIQNERKKLIFLMNNLGSKEDIQKLYTKRNQMKDMFTNAHNLKEILAMMNEHQYKNHVSDETILEIRSRLRNGI